MYANQKHRPSFVSSPSQGFWELRYIIKVRNFSQLLSFCWLPSGRGYIKDSVFEFFSQRQLFIVNLLFTNKVTNWSEVHEFICTHCYDRQIDNFHQNFELFLRTENICKFYERKVQTHALLFRVAHFYGDTNIDISRKDWGPGVDHILESPRAKFRWTSWGPNWVKYRKYRRWVICARLVLLLL